MDYQQRIYNRLTQCGSARHDAAAIAAEADAEIERLTSELQNCRNKLKAADDDLR